MKYIKTVLISALSAFVIIASLFFVFDKNSNIANLKFLKHTAPRQINIKINEIKNRVDNKKAVSTAENVDFIKTHKIPILMYHNLTEDPLKTNRITVTKERFARDMDFLIRDGYTFISFKDLLDYRDGKLALPEKSVIITFDDGKKNIYDLAYPILKERNIKFTFFVIGKRMEQLPEDKKYGEYIKWSQAKEMYESGLAEIQPHTYDMHYPKTTLTRGVGVLPFSDESEENHYNRFKDDTEKIIETIKKNVGSDSYVYSYPYGKHNETNEKVLKDMGFKISVVTNTHMTDLSGDLWNLQRINVPCQIELEELLKRVKKYVK